MQYGRCKILTYEQINKETWSTLVETSATGTWFQTQEAYDFFASMPEFFAPFAIGVVSKQECNSVLIDEERLRGVCVGYVTMEKNPVKQFFTRRAIIIGGPCLADDCSDEEVAALMNAVRKQLRKEAIYVESRNFNDYSRWKQAFVQAGFCYQPHLNFHVYTNQSWEKIEENIGKHRKKYICLSFRYGTTIEEHPTIEQIRSYYAILLNLYRTKVKTPLYSWTFFERLYHLKSCHFILVLYEGQVIGGSTCMVLPRHGVYEWYACGKDGIFKNIHPSSVTKYAGIKFAYENQYPIYDMMGAGKPSEEYGVRNFKEEFGGNKVEYGRWLYVAKPLFYRAGELGIKILKVIK